MAIFARWYRHTKNRLIAAVICPLLFASSLQTSATNALLNHSIHLPYFSAEYDATIEGFEISAKREYKPLTDSISELSFSADSMLASLSENSQFSWKNDSIKPIRFTHTRTIFGQSKRKVLSFDWKNNTITSTRDGQTNIIDNSQEVLDHLSFQLQLQHDLNTHKVEDKIYRIADKKKVKEYAFKVMGEEIIKTKLGDINTTKVQVVRDSNKRVTYIWLARDWYNLLVKLEQYEENDKQFAIELKNAVIDGKKVTGL